MSRPPSSTASAAPTRAPPSAPRRPCWKSNATPPRLFGLDDAFYFASGWLGNHVLMRLLDSQSGLMLIDECSHYSVFEAAHARRLILLRDLSPPRPRRPSRQAEAAPQTLAKRGGAQRRGLCRHRANRSGRRVLRHFARLSGLDPMSRRRPRCGRARRKRPGNLRACWPLAPNLPSPACGRGAGGEGGRRVAKQSLAVRTQLCPPLPCPALFRHAEQGRGRFRRHHSRQPGVHRPHQVDNRRISAAPAHRPRRLPRPPPGRSSWSWPSPGCGRGSGRTPVC